MDPTSSAARSNNNDDGCFVGNNASDVLPPSNGRVKRKQWVLHDGPHGSLQRLRLRMAEEGCGHSQVALAKQLLAENSCESDEIGVHWLLKAADQGHHEGLELLKNCFDNNRGITEHNYHKIHSFLEMSQHERAARIGAKNLFSSMARGSDFVTTKQLEQWLEESLAGGKRAEDKEEVCTTENPESTLVLGGELISEQHMVSAASIYALGHFPPLLRLLNLHSENSLTCIYHWFSRSILGLLSNPLQLCLILGSLLLYTIINNTLQTLLDMEAPSILVVLSWCLVLTAAVFFTARSSCLVGDWNLFRIWSLLLSQHTQQLESAVPEYLYMSRTFPPHFGRFLLAAVPCVSLQPSLHLVRSSVSQNGIWIPYAELGILATFLSSACWPSMRYLCTLTLDDVLCLIGWILLRVENLPWIVSDQGTLLDRLLHFELDSGLVIRMHLVVIVALVILTPLYARRLRQFSNGTHLIAWFLPHFTSLMWLFLAIDWLQLSSYDSLLRALVVSLIAILLASNCNWLTKCNLVLCCLTSYSSGSTIGLTPMAGLLLLLGLIASVQLLQRSHLVRRMTQFLRLWTMIRSALLVACLAILCVRLVDYVHTCQLNFANSVQTTMTTTTASPAADGAAVNDQELPIDPAGTISWEHYRKFCHQSSSWTGYSMASTQIACAALNGLSVQWQGVVRQVSIVTRHNTVEDVLQWLPFKWSQWLSCQIGDKWPECDGNQLPYKQRCSYLWRINQQRGVHCHLDRFSKFTFRFEVRFWLLFLFNLYLLLRLFTVIVSHFE